MSKKRRYAEGTIFAVPLRKGGYGLGLIARRSDGGVLFGYFFGPLYKNVPKFDEIQDLKPDNSILKIQFGDLGLVNGEWPVIGQLNDFRLSKWPMPPLIRVDVSSNKAWKEFYTDNLDFIYETPCSPDLAKEFPSSCLAGYGSVEKKLTHILHTEDIKDPQN